MKIKRNQKKNDFDKPRARAILFATIAEYVSTGRPVSSGSLVKNHRLNLSPATIRRELKELEEMGLVIQPHTSAGRIPTDQAFRIFVDTLKQETNELANQHAKKALDGFQHLGLESQKTWQDVVRTLSNFVYQAALVITPALSESVLRQLRFVPCDPTSLLAVVVTREGVVHNAFVKPKKPVLEHDLERIHNYLAELITGRTLNQIRSILREELEDARTRCDEMREQATLLGTEAVTASIQNRSELVVEGRRHLAARPELRDRMEELMQVLEEKTRILELLDQAAETGTGPIVVIGQEGGEAFEGCAMISQPFGHQGSEGQVGVIGSARMDYSAVIPLVGLAAEFLTNRFSA
jgi:heat-inducible transcriptional repressor